MRRLSEFLQAHRQTAWTAALLALVAWTAFLAAGLHARHARHLRELRERHERVLAKTELAADQVITATRRAFHDVPLLRGREARLLRTYRNAAHVDRARRLGIASLADRTSTHRLTSSGQMVELKGNAYYRVQDLNYSVPYVTRHTSHLLDLIGIRFQEALREAGLPPYRYVISSVTRTRADQRALRRVNGNAARKSSHEFGTTVDLHYRKFEFEADLNLMPDSTDIYHDILNRRVEDAFVQMAHTRQQKLKAILGRVLLDLQREGKVLVIYERRQPVYHITLADKVERPHL